MFQFDDVILFHEEPVVQSVDDFFANPEQYKLKNSWVVGDLRRNNDECDVKFYAPPVSRFIALVLTMEP